MAVCNVSYQSFIPSFIVYLSGLQLPKKVGTVVINAILGFLLYISTIFCNMFVYLLELTVCPSILLECELTLGQGLSAEC